MFTSVSTRILKKSGDPILTIHSYKATQVAHKRTDKEDRVTKPTVLLIDDDRDFVEAIQKTLENSGFNVAAAFDGEEGLRHAKKIKPDIVILDVMMPQKEGYSVCHDLKSSALTSKIPVLILTSLSKQAQGKRGAEIIAQGHAAEGYLEKPVEPKVLIDTINRLIHKAENTDVKKLKVLLIDDDPDFLASIKILLEKNEYAVIIKSNGEDGIIAANKEIPDIILVDVMLPGKDGFAVCKELKEDKKTRFIPVVMLTSVGQNITEPDYAKAIAVTHHADDYIEKPVQGKELLKRIHNLIGPKRRLI